MFKTLYRCPRTVARHENGPLHESRLRYLEHLAAQGAVLHTITAAACIIYRAAIWMKLDESSPVERKDVERAAERWAHRSYRNASSRGPEQTDKEFSTDCAQMAAIRRPAIGIGPCSGSAPTGNRCTLPLHGRGAGTLAGYHRNRSTQLGKVFQAHPDSTTQQSQNRRCGAILGSARQTRVDTQRDPINSTLHSYVLSLWRTGELDEARDCIGDSRSARVSA
jgi:hypothetical protein